MKWYGPLFSVPEGDRSWWMVVLWWEKRRLVFNGVLGAFGVANLVLFAYVNDVLLRPYTTFEQREWEPLSVVVGAFMANLCYCGGWAVEIISRGVSERNPKRFGPIAFSLGLSFAVVLTFVPPVGDLVRWVHFAWSARG
jgi:hypothetical protein